MLENRDVWVLNLHGMHHFARKKEAVSENNCILLSILVCLGDLFYLSFVFY